MKKITLAISLFFPILLFSQNSSISTFSQAKSDYNSVSSNKHVFKHVLNDKKLRAYFINDIIPSSFPEYNHAISYNVNKQIAIDWALQNQVLFKPSYRVNVSQYFD